MEAETVSVSSPDSGEGGSRRHKHFASLVIFDTETTDLERPKITELCMLSVQTDELKSGSSPRMINKLLLCFNPQRSIKPEASRLTGV